MTKDQRKKFKFNTVKEAIRDIKDGKMIIIVDDKDRENEGDLYVPAEKVTPEKINFMAKEGRGLICVPMKGERLKKLGLRQMVNKNEHNEEMGTSFTISTDAKTTGTGISAYDRAETVKRLIDSDTQPNDLEKPGHIFPLRAEKQGVLERKGHTEAAVDLARIAGLRPAGVICEVMMDNGKMARVPELMNFKKEHDLKIITIEDLINYRLKNENIINREVKTKLPTKHGEFVLIGYNFLGETHLALLNLQGNKKPQVRIHSKCITGDALESLKCDCGSQLSKSMEKISNEGGLIIYLSQEGRGIGLINKLKAYKLQEKGYDTVEANEKLGFEPDEREFGVAAQILKELNLNKVELLTNNPKKVKDLEKYGIDVDRTSLNVEPTSENLNYLKTKKEKLNHMIKFD